MPERLKGISGDRWFNESLLGLIGRTNAREAAVILAQNEIEKLLRLRSWRSFTGGVSLEDILSFHPEIDPLVDAQSPDVFKHQGLWSFKDGIHKLTTNDDLTDLQRRFVLAHEIAHSLVREFARGLGYPMDGILNSHSEENFCEVFARHLLLPDEIIKPQFKKSVDLNLIDRILTQFQVTPDVLVAWLLDEQHLLDRARKGVILSKWWLKPRYSHPKPPTVGFSSFAFPVWGGYSEFDYFGLSSVPEDILEKDRDTSFHYSTPVVSVRRKVWMRLRVGEPTYFVQDAGVEHKIYYADLLDSKRRSQIMLTIFDFPPVYPRQLELRLRFPRERINVLDVY